MDESDVAMDENDITIDERLCNGKNEVTTDENDFRNGRAMC